MYIFAPTFSGFYSCCDTRMKVTFKIFILVCVAGVWNCFMKKKLSLLRVNLLQSINESWPFLQLEMGMSH